MITHEKIWRAIDLLAEERGLSVSALARRSGLNPTTFNHSKRLRANGTPCWPSTESILKMLNAMEAPFTHFASLVESADSDADTYRRRRRDNTRSNGPISAAVARASDAAPPTPPNPEGE